ncbi:G-type lectin S-receptor-like serine/threonine-protein kinase At1g11410 isoform X2 [Primulina tabacum]|uniref:G-type lectin S-receptor-like serine/threonine-protein kinase At1g11410 isoform X2 n=1 Tax=Primulina tabacum TaxID=48773 RepID=UPI003F592BD2
MAFASSFRWFLYIISISGSFCVESDSILSGQSLFPNQTIISKEKKFELGFFSPVNSTNSYVGIWYKNIPARTIVWVANRNDPIPSADRNGSRLELSEGGLFLSFNSKVLEVARISNATEAVIFDTGNFVLRNGLKSHLWWSSSHPTDTWLPRGTVGFSGSTEIKLFSWRNLSDPAQGNYSLGVKRNGRAELFIWLNNSHQQWRSGTCEDRRHGLFFDKSDSLSSFSFNDAKYFLYAEYNVTTMSRIVLDLYGILTKLSWSEADQEWIIDWRQPSEQCNIYRYCGANTICDSNNAPPCACLPEFVPKFPGDWHLNDFSSGCVRENRSRCLKGNSEFVNLTNTRLPANPKLLGVGSSDICEFACSKDCSCSAYAFSGIGGCSLYIGDILDLGQTRINGTGRDLHIRTNSAKTRGEGNGKGRNLAYAFSAVTLTIGVGAFIFFLRLRFKRKAYEKTFQNLLLLDLNSTGPTKNQRTAVENRRGESDNRDNELPVFSFTSIIAATDKFSARNRLGEGGFGPVYKGELANGQFVAVKRLSKMSGQGLEEFRNETELIAKLQHRNLVRILGCCIQEDEKILVYEYMPNKSLDSFLFNPTKKELLDWSRRVQIIDGIAQGLLYLHQYSRLRIVHRDLKAGNILLDGDMKPKISDFGMARIFGGNDSQANTKRIVGTYGYMSPEYVSGGNFSIKSDVFAFGVLLLEILSGRKSNGFYDSDSFSLLDHARYIHIGLLCVQESPDERPTMLEVVAMLSKEQTAPASPQHPAFAARSTCFTATPGNQKVEIHSANEMTVSLMGPR